MARRTTERSFDELARGLAEGSISRRRALKLFAGTALATLVPARLAEADDDRDCKERGQRCGGGRGKCCGKLVCREGRCRRPRTTTTTSSTTSTTTTTPTTTTSTTTTPMCIPDGGSCSVGSDCCSGLVCKGPAGQRTCAESCVPPNAISCDAADSFSCAGGFLGGCVCIEASEGGGYCVTSATGDRCSSSCDCPAGQFCQPDPDNPMGLCVVVATVCPRI